MLTFKKINYGLVLKFAENKTKIGHLKVREPILNFIKSSEIEIEHLNICIPK